MKLVATICAALLAAGIAHAADREGEFQLLTMGSMPCPIYVRADKEARGGVERWLEGYLTAMNRMTTETWSVIGSNSAQRFSELIEQECRAHPELLFEPAVHNVLERIFENRTKWEPQD